MQQPVRVGSLALGQAQVLVLVQPGLPVLQGPLVDLLRFHPLIRGQTHLQRHLEWLLRPAFRLWYQGLVQQQLSWKRVAILPSVAPEHSPQAEELVPQKAVEHLGQLRTTQVMAPVQVWILLLSALRGGPQRKWLQHRLLRPALEGHGQLHPEQPQVHLQPPQGKHDLIRVVPRTLQDLAGTVRLHPCLR